MSIDKAKKSLGQNFFTNNHLATKITNHVISTKTDTVIEIGPGRGVFTHLLEKYAKVIAIEKDRDLYMFLLKHYKENENVAIIEADMLEIDLNQLQKGNKTIVFGSLPYNISKRIISRLLQKTSFSDYFFIIQKEVAEKYIAKDGSNRLSLSSDIFADKKILETIKPSNFTPAPKVTSALIHFKRKDNPLIEKNADFNKFLQLLNAAFRSPRKKLRNNLKGTEFSTGIPEKLENLRSEKIGTYEFLEILRNYTQT